MTSADRVSRARSLHTPDDAVDLYREWAHDYDHDVFQVMGFTGTDRIADLLVEHLSAEHLLADDLADRAVPVIDLGCGTGAAGVRLAAHGLRVIDGVDISPEMLDVAATRGVYRNLMTADLTATLHIQQRYGAAISAGTFTTGHVGASAVAPITQLLQAGSLVAWVVAQTLWPEFQTAMDQCGFQLLHAVLEPIRRDGPPEAMMVVARLP
ncbi:MAG: hypothetical protein JWN99_900 [Ilumatobacteraceae bacterium]|nr:hypothetical protein [Ilumatobacteraceae bacterium]